MHPIEVLRTNTLGTGFLLEACRQRGGIERIVCFSTSEVYGTALYAPIDEEHPLQAQSPYSASKIASDQLALSYVRAFNLPVAIARPFNTFGPRQSSRAVIPTIITQALRGGSVRLGSVSPTRDLCYVGDTAEGIIRIGEAQAAIGEAINLGTGQEISIGALAERIFAILAASPTSSPTSSASAREERGDAAHRRFEQGQAPARLGAAGLPRRGLRRTIEWIRANPDFFHVSDYHV